MVNHKELAVSKIYHLSNLPKHSIHYTNIKTADTIR